MMSLAYRRAHATEAVVAQAHHRVEPELENLTTAIRHAREALMAQQNESGYWCYEFEADCTIPAEYILMMQFPPGCASNQSEIVPLCSVSHAKQIPSRVTR